MEPVAVLRILLTASGVRETQLQLARMQADAKRTADSTGRLEKQVGGLNTTMGGFSRQVSRTSSSTSTLQRQMSGYGRVTQQTANSTRVLETHARGLSSALRDTNVQTSRTAEAANLLDRYFGRARTAVRDFGVDTRRTADSTTHLRDSFDRVNNRTAVFNRNMMGLGNVLKIVRWPAIIVGAGQAAQAVGALGTATFSVASALAPLSGALAGYAGGYAAVGQAAGVAKLALSNVDEALKGNKKALDALTPAQRTFVNQLKGMQGQLKGVRQVAAQNMLPGLTQGLRAAMPLMRQLRPVVAATARELGNLGVAAGRAVASMGPEFRRIGTTNVTVIHNLGTAAILLGKALIEVVDAARPLTLWMSNMIRQGAAWVDAQARAANESGRLAGFLAKTRDVMTILGHTIANLVVGLVNIGKAAYPLGHSLLRQFEQLTAKFREWTQSAQGQNSIAKYFRDSRAPIQQVFGLIGDVVKALAPLFRPQATTTGMIGGLRNVVQTLGSTLQTTVRTLGPALVSLLTSVAQLFAAIGGTSGPLNLVVKALAGMIGAVASLVNQNPMLSTMVSFTLGLGGAFKLVMFFVKPLVGLFGVFRTVLSGVRTALSVVTAYQWAFNVALDANPIGVVVVAVAGLGVALALLVTHFKAVTSFLRGPWGTAISIALSVMMPFIGLPLLVMAHWRTLRNFFVGLWGGIKNVFSAGVNAIVGFFSRLPGRVLGILRGVGGALVGAGRTLIHGLVSGITAAAGAVWGWFRTLPAHIWNVIRGAPSWLLGAGRTIVHGLVTGITAAAGAIWSWFRALPGRILGVLKGVAQTLFNVGRTLVGGLAKGIGAAWGLVKDAFGGIKSVISSVLGGIKSAFRAALGVISSILHASGSVFDVLSHLPGPLGDLFGGMRDGANNAGDAIDRLRNKLAGTPKATQVAAGALNNVGRAAQHSAGSSLALANNWVGNMGRIKTSTTTNMGRTSTSVVTNTDRAKTVGSRNVETLHKNAKTSLDNTTTMTNTDTGRILSLIATRTSAAAKQGATHFSFLHAQVKTHMDQSTSTTNTDTGRMLTLIGQRTMSSARVAATNMGHFFTTIRGNVQSAYNAVRDGGNQMLGAVKKMMSGFGGATIKVASIAAHNVLGAIGGAARGGFVDKPMFMVGEEAPRHPEYVISTNPRDRSRMVPLVQQAARHIGAMPRVPGYAVGGIVTASQYDGTGSASGRDAHTTVGYAELSNPPSSLNFSALGHLPMGYRLRIGYGGRSIVAPKIDVGAGGPGLHGHIRAIDLTMPASRLLNFSGLADVSVASAGGAPLSIGGGPAGAAALFQQITAPRVQGGGTMGRVAQAALNKIADAANAYTSAHMPVAGGGGGGMMPMFAVPPGPLPLRVRTAIAAANSIVGKPYIYGGGHGSWISPGYCCSGAVSYVLHAAGLLNSPMAGGGFWPGGAAGYVSGPGKYFTVGSRGSATGPTGHVMMEIAGRGFESGGSGGGPHWTSGWDGTFDHYTHPPGWARGGIIPPGHFGEQRKAVGQLYNILARQGVQAPFKRSDSPKQAGRALEAQARLDRRIAPSRPLPPTGGKRTNVAGNLPRPGFACGGVLPPYAGSFAVGGRVPGPLGAARTAIVHGGETISHADSDVLSLRRPLLDIHEELRRIYRRFHPLLERILRKITEGARPARDTASAVARLAAPRGRREPAVRTAAAHAGHPGLSTTIPRRLTTPANVRHALERQHRAAREQARVDAAERPSIPRRLTTPAVVRHALQRQRRAGREQARIDAQHGDRRFNPDIPRRLSTPAVVRHALQRQHRAHRAQARIDQRSRRRREAQPRHLWQLAGFTQQLQRAIERGGGDATLADLRNRLRTIASLQVQDPASIAQLLRDTLPLSEAQPTAADIQALLSPALQRNYGQRRAPISALRGARNPALLTPYRPARHRQVQHQLEGFVRRLRAGHVARHRQARHQPARHRQAPRRGDHHQPRLHHPHHARRQHRPHQLWQLSNFIGAVRQQVARFGGTTTYAQLHDALRKISYMRLTDPQDIAQLLYDSLPVGTVQPTPAQIQRLLRPALIKNYGEPYAILPPAPHKKKAYAGSFATGGTVPGPSGVPMLATVHGGETISPHRTNLVHIENMTVQDDFDEQALAYKLAWLIDA